MTDDQIRHWLDELAALHRVATILETTTTSSRDWIFVRRAIDDRLAQVKYALGLEDGAVVAALELEQRRGETITATPDRVH
jgi:hypothetical protein